MTAVSSTSPFGFMIPPQADQASPCLTRYTEQVNPETLSTYEKEWFSFIVISTIEFVAFTALAALALVLVGIFAPPAYASALMMVVTLAAVILVQKFMDVVILPNKPQADQASAYADQLQALQHIYTTPGAGERESSTHEHITLSTATEPQIRAQLTRMHIDLTTIPLNAGHTIQDLTPMLAQYQYLRNERHKARNVVTDQETALQPLFQRRNEMLGDDYSLLQNHPDPEARSLEMEILSHRKEKADALKNLLRHKVEAAFVHALIQRPNFSGSFSDIAELKQQSYIAYALDALDDAPLRNEVIIFKDHDMTSIRRDEIQGPDRLKTHALADRFVEAIDNYTKAQGEVSSV